MLVISMLVSLASLLLLDSQLNTQLLVNIVMSLLCIWHGDMVCHLITVHAASGLATCKQAPAAMLVLHYELSKGYEGRCKAITQACCCVCCHSNQAKCCLALCCCAVHTSLQPWCWIRLLDTVLCLVSMEGQCVQHLLLCCGPLLGGCCREATHQGPASSDARADDIKHALQSAKLLK
jgi:hypothetical protein